MTSALVRGSKIAEREGYVTVVVDVKGNTHEVTRGEYDELLEQQAQKDNRRLSKDKRTVARLRYDHILKRWYVRQKDSGRPCRNRRNNTKEGIDGSTTLVSSGSSGPGLPNVNSEKPKEKPNARTQRGAIVSSRPDFHTIIVDSSGNTLEVTRDEYDRWLAFHEAKTNVELSSDERLANRARAKHIMDNWGKKGKRKKAGRVGRVPEHPPIRLSTMKNPVTEEACYQAAMHLLGSAYIS